MEQTTVNIELVWESLNDKPIPDNHLKILNTKAIKEINTIFYSNFFNDAIAGQLEARLFVDLNNNVNEYYSLSDYIPDSFSLDEYEKLKYKCEFEITKS